MTQETVDIGKEVIRSEHGHFAPGTVGGPGRPRKGTTYLDRLAAKLEEYGDDAASAMIAQALKGNVRAHEYLRDTLIGKPAEKLIHADINDPGTQLLLQLAQMMGYQLAPTESVEPQDTAVLPSPPLPESQP